jgi:hypothetical protein
MSGHEVGVKRLPRHRHSLALLAVAAAALTATSAVAAGSTREYEVGLTPELRRLAGHGELSPVAHARVTVALPDALDGPGDRPILIVSATSDPGYRSSRRLLGEYSAAAVAAGWVALAADPEEDVAVGQDDATLRFVLDFAALAALRAQWPRAGEAPLAFGGFSGGAKYSGWLAAAFAGQGRRVIGIYLAGINRDTIVDAARQFQVLDESFRRIPVFLQSGEKDEIATPWDHRGVYEDLKRAGFRNVRGGHTVDPGPLREALRWFGELAARRPAAR